MVDILRETFHVNWARQLTTRERLFRGFTFNTVRNALAP